MMKFLISKRIVLDRREGGDGRVMNEALTGHDMKWDEKHVVWADV